MKVAVRDGHIDLAPETGPGGKGLSGGQRRRHHRGLMHGLLSALP